MSNPVAAFYRAHPRMVSSPFGGVDGVDGAFLSKVLARLDIDVSGKKVLDVGCGRGYTGEVVRASSGDYTGVDLVASRKGVRMGLADSVALPFRDASFDGVFCIDAFEHFPDQERAAREFRRVLRPGGFVYLSAPNYSNVAGAVKKVYEGMGWYSKDTWAPFGRWQAQELEQPLTGRKVRSVFRAGGFARMRRIGHGDEVGLGLFPWIDHARMPERVQFRLQRVSQLFGPPVAAVLPGASLHNFWKIEV